MYSILIDIPGFRQFARTNKRASQELTDGLMRLAQDSGANFDEISSGRWIVPFPNLRMSDSRFIIEVISNFELCMKPFREDIMGGIVILEIIENTVTPEQELFDILLRIHESFGTWLGPIAASQLANQVRILNFGSVWKVIEHFASNEKDSELPIELVEKLLPSKEIVRKIERIKNAGRGVLFIECERYYDSGTVLERALSKVLGKKNESFFLWVKGVDRTESPALALVRYISTAVLEFSEKSGVKMPLWNYYTQFLELGLAHAWGSRKGRDHYRGMFFDEINVKTAWKLLLQAFNKSCVAEGIPFIIHIEQPEELPELAQKLLIESLLEIQKNDEFEFIIILSGADDGFRSIKIEGVREFFHVPNYLPASLDFSDKIRGLSDLRGQLDANTVAMIQYLSNGKEDQLSVEFAPEMGSLSIHAEVFKSLEPLELETYFIILLSTGLFPLERIHDFLISINVERIRIPKIFQRLYTNGLTRMEELSYPVYPHEPEDLDKYLGERADELRTAFDIYLEGLIKKGETHANADLFELAIHLLEHERFLNFAFVFAERLLDTRNFQRANHVITHLNERIARIVDIKIKTRFMETISYLQCRLDLISHDEKSPQIGYSYLEQLSIQDGPMRGFNFLQRAKFYMYQAEIDQCQSSIKRAIVAFQETEDKKGLSASQMVFGISLLSKHKLFEAHDYFSLSRSTASAGACLFEEVRASYWSILVLYLHGFLSRALDAIIDPRGVLEIAKRYGILDLILAIEIIQARIYFDLGMYTEAKTRFTSAIKDSKSIFNQKLTSSLELWLFRVDLHLGNTIPEKFLDKYGASSHEYALFSAEYYLFNGKPDLAVGILDGLKPIERIALNIENLFSQNLYSSMEDVLGLGSGIPGVLSHLIDSYRAYALALSGKPETAATFLATKTRSKTIGPFDPYLHIYYYQYSEVLRLIGKNSYDDADTILGKSVKFFQERASRIDDPSQKQSFLKENLQSKRILDLARSYNLA